MTGILPREEWVAKDVKKSIEEENWDVEEKERDKRRCNDKDVKVENKSRKGTKKSTPRQDNNLKSDKCEEIETESETHNKILTQNLRSR